MNDFELKLYFSNEEMENYLRLHGYEISDVVTWNFDYDPRYDTEDKKEKVVRIAYLEVPIDLDLNSGSNSIESSYGIRKQFSKEIKKRLLY